MTIQEYIAERRKVIKESRVDSVPPFRVDDMKDILFSAIGAHGTLNAETKVSNALIDAANEMPRVLDMLEDCVKVLEEMKAKFPATMYTYYDGRSMPYVEAALLRLEKMTDEARYGDKKL